jgi:[ribosomal protein S18]-alanine N-acetyltransferase
MGLTTDFSIRIATAADAVAIAELSRDTIETGLPWRWTPPRVLRSIADPDVNVVVAHRTGCADLAGFGIMEYKDSDAHLCLLAVNPDCRRTGVATGLIRWLETSALTAGIQWIYLEARRSNLAAREMYNQLDYQERSLALGYYSGREDAVRLAKNLWAKSEH